MPRRNKVKRQYVISQESVTWLAQFDKKSEVLELLIQYAKLRNLNKEKLENAIKEKINPKFIEQTKELKQEQERKGYSLTWYYQQVLEKFPTMSFAELQELGRLLGFKPSWAIVHYLNREINKTI